MEPGLALLLLAAGLGYCLPAAFAVLRRHHNAGAIAALNLLLGWTLLGWIAALVWSLTAVQPAAGGDQVAVSEEPYREI